MLFSINLSPFPWRFRISFVFVFFTIFKNFTNHRAAAFFQRFFVNPRHGTTKVAFSSADAFLKCRKSAIFRKTEKMKNEPWGEFRFIWVKNHCFFNSKSSSLTRKHVLPRLRGNIRAKIMNSPRGGIKWSPKNRGFCQTLGHIFGHLPRYSRVKFHLEKSDFCTHSPMAS